MHHATIHIDPTGAAPIGFSQATGMPGDIKIDFKTQGNIAYPDIAAMHPQLVLRPFTTSTAYAYDIVINDPTGASGVATIPGSVMNDLFNVEVYTRNDIGQPQRMIAVGRVDLTGYAYRLSDKLGEATYSVGPEGPPGPKGDPGTEGPRGSRWYTGEGGPAVVPDTRVEGDMWMDETSGDIWRWDSSVGSWTGFAKATKT